MAQRRASMAAKVRFDHKPKDGRTPVYDSVAKQWKYLESPTAEQLDASAVRFDSVDLTAYSALSKADIADLKAFEAKTIADSKVTGEEAVEAVKQSLLYITRRDGLSSDNKYWQSVRLELKEDNNERWYFQVHGNRTASTGDVNEYEMPLSYATSDEYTDLMMQVALMEIRLAAIEKKLGIS